MPRPRQIRFCLGCLSRLKGGFDRWSLLNPAASRHLRRACDAAMEHVRDYGRGRASSDGKKLLTRLLKHSLVLADTPTVDGNRAQDLVYALEPALKATLRTPAEYIARVAAVELDAIDQQIQEQAGGVDYVPTTQVLAHPLMRSTVRQQNRTLHALRNAGRRAGR